MSDYRLHEGGGVISRVRWNRRETMKWDWIGSKCVSIIHFRQSSPSEYMYVHEEYTRFQNNEIFNTTFLCGRCAFIVDLAVNGISNKCDNLVIDRFVI